MKRFVSILLCIIIPLFLIIPVNSNAFDIQGNEYPDPSLLPPDVDFSKYDYYFLTFSGTVESPRYYLYLLNDNSAEKHNRFYFNVTLSPSSTRFNTGQFTSFGITTNYSFSCKIYRDNGTWESLSATSLQSGFVFDTYSQFSSGCMYIIGSNCDIYSYSGDCLHSGNYDTLCSFFRGNLAGSSDKSEKPTEPTTSGESSGSGGIDIDLSFLSDYFNQIFDLLNSLISNFKTLLSNIGKLTDAFGASEDGSIFLHLSVMKNILVDFLNSTNAKLDDIKTEILNFEKYFSEFSAVNGEIANIFTALSGLNINITNIHNKAMEIIALLNNIKSDISSIHTDFYNFTLRFPTDFGDIINEIKSHVSAIRTDFDNFVLRFPTDFSDIINEIKSHVSAIRTDFYNFTLRFPTDFGDIINEIKSHVSAIRTDFDNFLLNFPTNFDDIILSIKVNTDIIKTIVNSIYDIINDMSDKLKSIYQISDTILYYLSQWDKHISTISTDLHNFVSGFSVNSFFNDISLKINDLIDKLQLSIDSIFDDISLKIDSLDVSGLIDAVKAVETAVKNLPYDFEELLKNLFIPETDEPKELMNMIIEHFRFIEQIVEIGDAIFLSENFEVEKPEYIIRFDSDLFGHFEGELIDFSIIPYDYILWFKRLVSGITCYFFLRKVRKRLPAIINGEATP